MGCINHALSSSGSGVEANKLSDINSVLFVAIEGPGFVRDQSHLVHDSFVRHGTQAFEAKERAGMPRDTTLVAIVPARRSTVEFVLERDCPLGALVTLHARSDERGARYIGENRQALTIGMRGQEDTSRGEIDGVAI